MHKPYNSQDDKIYATRFVYCGQHLRVHETGWCTVSAIHKIPLLSETIEEAQKEWNLKKQVLELSFK